MIAIDDITFTIRCNNNKYYTCTITFMENDTYLLTISNSAGKNLYKCYSDTSCGLTDEEYYDDIEPSFILNRHCFWSNETVPVIKFEHNYDKIRGNSKKMAEIYGIDIDILKGFDSYKKRQVLRNCVNPEIGRYIFDEICKGENYEE